jgi:hypothetical protein
MPDSQKKRSPTAIHDRFPASREALLVGGGEMPPDVKVGSGALLGRETDAGPLVVEMVVVSLGKEAE